MSLLERIGALFRGSAPADTAEPPAVAASPEPVAPEPSVSVTVRGSVGPTAEVSADEIARGVARYSFVPGNRLPPLAPTEQWWTEETHKRNMREGSEKQFSWLRPFVSVELVQALGLKAAKTEWGPLQADALAKELRAVVRERRKLKQPHEDVLRALYGACVLADLVESLKFEGSQPHHMAQFVSVTELARVELDYPSMGYQDIDALGKTDIKWLVEAFGEPAEHQSFNAAWPDIWQNAISRKCWLELTEEQAACASLGRPVPTMEDWLAELVGRNIGYYKEWQARVAAKAARDAEPFAGVEAALAATAQPFVVADLETTGLRAADHDILELAAVLASPDGSVQAEFSALVRVEGALPREIVELTGISDQDVAREGRPLAEALAGFLAFVGDRPVFFHNSPFDRSFLQAACAREKKKFSNPLHDTLPVARRAWPELRSFRLSLLAEHVGTPASTHRALADAKAALAVLLAARERLRPKP